VARVYSTLFFAGGISPGDHDVYTVPAGHVAVLRDVALLNASITNALVVIGSFPDNVNWWRLTTGAGVSSCAEWQGRQVYPAGYTMTLDFVGDAAFVRMSGYLLTAP